MCASGFHSEDARLVKLVSLAAQKFISDIATDALNYSKMRSGGSSNAAARQLTNELTLTMDDLNNALAEYGIVLQKPPYYH